MGHETDISKMDTLEAILGKLELILVKSIALSQLMKRTSCVPESKTQGVTKFEKNVPTIQTEG